MQTIEGEIVAPRARKVPVNLEKHGDIRVDAYFWLRERENEEVLEYLRQENSYYERMTAHTRELQEKLFSEIKSRIKEDDSSVPYKLRGYWYVTRYKKGKDYPVFSRKPGSLDAPEEILFDVNEMAKGYDYYRLGGLNVSCNNRLISYGVDTVSRRQYTIRIKDLVTGEIYPEEIRNTTGGATWANDNKTLFYARKDPDTLRSDRIYKHRLGTSPDEDELVYHEQDETFHTYVYKSKSERFIIIGSGSTLTSEYRVLDADNPEAAFRVIQPRVRGLEYSIFHYRDHFYILTNADASINFKLVKTPVDATEMEHWQDVVPHREDVLLEDVDLFREYLVLSERSNGLSRFKITRWDGTNSYYLPFDNETYTAFTGTNPDFDTEILRYSYNSLTTPTQVVDFNMRTREKTIMKELQVLGGKFSKDNYVSERIWAQARDGQMIPMSIVYRRGLEKNGKNPVLQYAYGSYGSTLDPYFSNARLSLLDRGFIFAIAHIRGGEYLGRNWYEEGKLLKKMNTFTDFIDCSLKLIQDGYTTSPHLYASGGSAGGLLMGVIANMAPHLYNGIIASVPFVDVVTTMLDENIPLTTGEYDEWGNPNEPEYYHYMKSYSPYDKVKEQEYPHMLVTTGFHDSQVQYWEPAKWVARLRELKTGDKKLLFHINMEAGHGGASGRFEALREVAQEYAFLLDLEGIKE